jgi:hypothetical protein
MWGKWRGIKIQQPTTNIQHRTSNIEHRTSNIERRTSNVEYPTLITPRDGGAPAHHQKNFGRAVFFRFVLFGFGC